MRPLPAWRRLATRRCTKLVAEAVVWRSALPRCVCQLLDQFRWPDFAFTDHTGASVMHCGGCTDVFSLCYLLEAFETSSSVWMKSKLFAQPVKWVVWKWLGRPRAADSWVTFCLTRISPRIPYENTCGNSWSRILLKLTPTNSITAFMTCWKVTV